MIAIDLVVVLTGLGFVIAVFNAAIRILFAMGRERALPQSLARLSGRQTPGVSIGCVALLTLVLGLPLTYADGGPRAFRYLAGAAGLSVVLIYLGVNIAVIRAFRTEFRAEFRLWRHLLLPAAAGVLFLFPLWGILHPRAHALVDLLPFAALGWLGLGAIAAAVLRTRKPESFEMLGRVFMPAQKLTSSPRARMPGGAAVDMVAPWGCTATAAASTLLPAWRPVRGQQDVSRLISGSADRTRFQRASPQ